MSTAQYSLKQLIIKKMVQKTLCNGKPLYAVSDLDSLRKWLKGYLKQFLVYEDTIQKFIEQYDFNPKMFMSKVRFFEGYKGVKQSYRAMLKEGYSAPWLSCMN
jgi:glycine betaine/choline ABC-type transport system substrate-binding protein